MPLVCWRYIDDIFMLWQQGEKELKKFLEFLIPIIPPSSSLEIIQRLSFLDVEVIKKGNQLVVDLYIKPTDNHQYLHASSCHVFHVKKSIPYSQGLRLNRIFSKILFLINNVTIWRFGLKEGGAGINWFGHKF